MAAISLVCTPAPDVVAYDEDFPTRSTENYSNALHNVLQDMYDATPWYLNDDAPSAGTEAVMWNRVHDMIQAVFTYAETAINTFRLTGTATCPAPQNSDLVYPYDRTHPKWFHWQYQTRLQCYKIMWAIHYMWKTEDDPLLLKEKLQELLVAWPLIDTEIILNEEGGQTLKIVPAWKNVDL